MFRRITMNLDNLKEKLPDFAKDIKLNLANVLSEQGSPGLNLKQIYGIALASSLACTSAELTKIFLEDNQNSLTETDILGIKAAASIMAMNNVYYRFAHLVSDKTFQTMPARLRMNVMANPGISKIDFELYSLAISAINGCGKCLDAHTEGLKKEGMTLDGIQSCIRITSVIHATANIMTFI